MTYNEYGGMAAMYSVTLCKQGPFFVTALFIIIVHLLGTTYYSTNVPCPAMSSTMHISFRRLTE